MLISAVTWVPLGTLLGSPDPSCSRLKWILLGFHESSHLCFSLSICYQSDMRATTTWGQYSECPTSSLCCTKVKEWGAGVRGLTLLVNQQRNEAVWCYFSFLISSCTRIRNWMLCDIGVKKGIIRQMNFDYNDYYEHNILITNIKDSAQRQ